MCQQRFHDLVEFLRNTNSIRETSQYSASKPVQSNNGTNSCEWEKDGHACSQHAAASK